MEISLVFKLFKFKITNNKNEKSVFGKKKIGRGCGVGG